MTWILSVLLLDNGCWGGVGGRPSLRSGRLSARSECDGGSSPFHPNWAGPKLEPTDFKVDVKFPPPRVIRVPRNFQVISVELVVLYLMPYDEAEVDLQSGPKTDPDCDENGDVQD